MPAKKKDLRDFDSLYQLLEYFDTEEKCVDHLAAIRWNGEAECPYCASTKCYVLNTKHRGKQWACSACRKNFGIKVGTIFEESKLPLKKWFIAIYLVTAHRKGISSHQLAKDLKITQKSAWFVLHRVREAFCPEENITMSNDVEIDESWMGGKEKNKHANKKTAGTQGRSTKTKTPVLGIIEREGKVYAVPVKNTRQVTLHPIIEGKIEAGSNVYTDECKSYNGIETMYNHQIVNHSAKEYVRGEVHTNNIESFWALLKRGYVGIYHHMSDKHLHRYVNEFTFRFNNRKMTDGSRFDVLLGNVSKKLSYKELIGKV